MSVSVFPLHRRRDLVQEVVNGLGTRHSGEANLFWREMAKRLLGQLTASGVATEAAKEEVRMLFYAALDEMQNATVIARPAS